HMSHFPCGKDATVLHTYAHAYGGRVENGHVYALRVDDYGYCAWFNESQLTAIESKLSVERHYMLTDSPICEGSCQRSDGKWLTLERTVYPPSAQASGEALRK